MPLDANSRVHVWRNHRHPGREIPMATARPSRMRPGHPFINHNQQKKTSTPTSPPAPHARSARRPRVTNTWFRRAHSQRRGVQGEFGGSVLHSTTMWPDQHSEEELACVGGIWPTAKKKGRLFYHLKHQGRKYRRRSSSGALGTGDTGKQRRGITAGKKQTH